MPKSVKKPKSPKAIALDALLWAARRGDVPAIQASIAAGANPLGRGKLGRSALMEAARCGRLSAVEALLPYGGAKLLDENKSSALSLAAIKGSVACVRALLPHGKNPAEARGYSWSAFAIAAYHGKAKTTALLMPGENLLSGHGFHACHLARISSLGSSRKGQGRRGASKTVELISLAQISQLEERMRSGRGRSGAKADSQMAVHLLGAAAANGLMPAIEKLLAMGANPHGLVDKSKMSPFMKACVEGHLECAKAMFKDTSKIDDRNEYGNSALSMSVAQGHVDVVRWLLSQGASEARGEPRGDGWTLLIYAAKFSRELAELCLPLCDPLAKNIYGTSALMMAAGCGRDDVAKFLAPFSDIGAKNKKRLSAIDLAKSSDLKSWLQEALSARRDSKELAKAVKPRRSAPCAKGVRL